MTFFDLNASFDRAKERLGSATGKELRRPRSDRGDTRLEPRIVAEVRRLTSGQERSSMATLLEGVRRFCERRGLRPPSRAAVYRLLERIDGHSYEMADLPHDVRITLHNVDPSTRVPGAQLAFHCFNYGSGRALSFAAGLPWLDLYQARRKRGWRPRSRGLLEAVCRARGI